MAKDLIPEFELIDESAQEQQSFVPASSDVITTLVARYNAERAQVETITSFLHEGARAGVLRHFGQFSDRDGIYSSRGINLADFDLKTAIASLNSSYWQEAIRLTDVLECMPQARRKQWTDSILKLETPEFSEETVRSTLQSMMLQREQFFAERVDGLFRSLSGTHVTNCPEGFGRRMIISKAFDEHGYVNCGASGVVNDLRVVIAKFMGRDAPRANATGPVMKAAREETGKWLTVDGGALRLRAFKAGTVHLEVHPSMAYRLNQTLAFLHPNAIPSNFRKKPVKQPKDFRFFGRPLPFRVVEALEGFRQFRRLVANSFPERYEDEPGVYVLNNLSLAGKDLIKEIDAVMFMIGGTVVRPGFWRFEYDPRAVVKEIMCSGMVPDEKSQQFYPTQKRLAQLAAELCQIGDEDECLEPSAGTGGLADEMPRERTTCIELGETQFAVLKAKGYNAIQGDFLKWAQSCAKRFDRVLMNPPFSEGRWQLHTKAAADLVAESGRLVAILPASARGQDDLLPGFTCTWHGPYHDEFIGTGVSVVILVADRS